MTFFAKFHKESAISKLLKSSPLPGVAAFLEEPELVQELQGLNAALVAYVTDDARLAELVRIALGVPDPLPNADLDFRLAKYAADALSCGIAPINLALLDPSTSAFRVLFAFFDHQAPSGGPHPVSAGFFAQIIGALLGAKAELPSAARAKREAALVALAQHKIVAHAVSHLVLDGACDLLGTLLSLALPLKEGEQSFAATVFRFLRSCAVPEVIAARLTPANEPTADGRKAAADLLGTWIALSSPRPANQTIVPSSLDYVLPLLTAPCATFLVATARGGFDVADGALRVLTALLRMRRLWASTDQESAGARNAAAAAAFAPLLAAIDAGLLVDAIMALLAAQSPSAVVTSVGRQDNPFGITRLLCVELLHELAWLATEALCPRLAAVFARDRVALRVLQWALSRPWHDVLHTATQELFATMLSPAFAVANPPLHNALVAEPELRPALLEAVAANAASVIRLGYMGVVQSISAALEAAAPTAVAAMTPAWRAYVEGELRSRLELNATPICPVPPEVLALKGNSADASASFIDRSDPASDQAKSAGASSATVDPAKAVSATKFTSVPTPSPPQPQPSAPVPAASAQEAVAALPTSDAAASATGPTAWPNAVPASASSDSWQPSFQ